MRAGRKQEGITAFSCMKSGCGNPPQEDTTEKEGVHKPCMPVQERDPPSLESEEKKISGDFPVDHTKIYGTWPLPLPGGFCSTFSGRLYSGKCLACG